MIFRSTKKAINAVAVARAGPEIARQSDCMPVLFACEVVIEAVIEAVSLRPRVWRAA
jgi:hypothetical protein